MEKIKRKSIGLGEGDCIGMAIEIVQLKNEFSNDMELGKKVRELLNYYLENFPLSK